MNKYKKKDILQLTAALIQVNESIGYQGEKNIANLSELLINCQQSALSLGTYLETIEGVPALWIKILEDYCENLYRLSVSVSNQEACKAIRKKIQKQLNQLKDDIGRVLPEDRKEVVFLPYKASMWDSMESIWRAAKADASVDVYVIPIPYYDKNSDGSFKEEHYEGNLYPDDVEVTDYKEYDIKEHRPDVIFIHNSYDNTNKVTCVDPLFYSKNLKQYTEQLVYVPYYVVPGYLPEDMVLAPGVYRADMVFVQNERIRRRYITLLEQMVFPGQTDMLEKKIIAVGSPKTDKLLSSRQNIGKIPKDWKAKIGNRKVVFFNTNVNLILNSREHFIENLYRIFHIFEKYKEKFVLLWREHPLTMETMQAMAPELTEDYIRIKKEFVQKQWGILDKTEEPHLAMAVSECYYGAGGSLVTIYSVTGFPMMITDYHYPDGISNEKISKDEFYQSIGNRTYYKEEHVNSLELFLDNYEEICSFKEQRIQRISKCLDNLDGSVGDKIYSYVMNGGEAK